MLDAHTRRRGKSRLANVKKLAASKKAATSSAAKGKRGLRVTTSPPEQKWRLQTAHRGTFGDGKTGHPHAAGLHTAEEHPRKQSALLSKPAAGTPKTVGSGGGRRRGSDAGEGPAKGVFREGARNRPRQLDHPNVTEIQQMAAPHRSS